MAPSSLLLLILGLGFGFVAGIVFSASLVDFGRGSHREGFAAGQASERPLAAARAEGVAAGRAEGRTVATLADVRQRTAS